jgi:uncharacterized protein
MSASPTIDAFRLARDRSAIRGEATMMQLPRLASSVLGDDVRVRYEIDGRVDAEGHPGALMRLSARLPLRCQRCNDPVAFTLERAVPFRFVHDEQELNALPVEDDEVEVVVGSDAMPLLPWIEDEVILSLPLVPRHADCALPAAGPGKEGPQERPSPFAALARLKRGDGDAG